MAATKPEIPVGYLKVEAVGVNGPTTWANVFYFGASPTVSTHPVDVCNVGAIAIGHLYTDVFASFLHPDWSVTKTNVVFRDAEDSLVRYTVADAIPGTGSSDDEAAQVSYLLNWQCGDPRKGGKPRNYISGVRSDGMLDSARLQPSELATMNSAIQTWLVDQLTYSSGDQTGVELVDMSFRNGNAWRDEALTLPIFSGFVSNVVATQRRRVDRLR